METREEILKEIRDLCDKLKHFESEDLEIPTLSSKIIYLLDNNRTQEIIGKITGANQVKKARVYVKK